MKRYIKAATYDGMEFKDSQMYYIQKGLDEGLDVSIYANPEFKDDRQMWQIYEGLKSGLDVSIYANPKFGFQKMDYIRRALEQGWDNSIINLLANPEFNSRQTGLIYDGFENGIDISWYADPKFNEYQMEKIYNGLMAGVDVSQYADPKYSYKEMEDILLDLEHRYRFKSNSKAIIQEIADRLNVDIKTAKFLAKDYSSEMGDMGFNSKEECINYIVEDAKPRTLEILDNEGYAGLVQWFGTDYANNFIDAAKALGIDVDAYL